MAYTVSLFFVIFVVTRMNASRILVVIPTPSLSHQTVFRPLTQELARRGHDVTVITTDPAFPKHQRPDNLTEINVQDISYAVHNMKMKKLNAIRYNDMEAQIKIYIDLFSTVVEKQLLTNDIRNLIMDKTVRFDLILIEACGRPALIFGHIFKAPIIQVSSFGSMIGMNTIVGAPNHPLFQPIVIRQRLYNLTFLEKIRETYRQLRFEYIYREHEKKENGMLRNIFGPATPSLSELYENIHMVFLNVNPIWNDNQPMPPNVIYLGGLHQNPAQKLPTDLESYLNSSYNGVIYISFGTNVKMSILPPQKIRIMTKVFSELPYNVIWKWDTDLLHKPNNIKLFKWLPQADLLRHPNVKLFITQGGLQSTDEAITAGVPLIGIPVLADQWYNTEKYVRHGIGKKLELGTFTEKEFKDAIVTIIEDQSYRKNMARLRAIICDQPQTSLERAIWWAEYVLRHGGARHLRAPAANMSWTEYYELNLILIFLSCLLSVIICFCVALYYLRQCFLSNLRPSGKLKGA